MHNPKGTDHNTYQVRIGYIRVIYDPPIESPSTKLCGRIWGSIAQGFHHFSRPWTYDFSIETRHLKWNVYCIYLIVIMITYPCRSIHAKCVRKTPHKLSSSAIGTVMEPRLLNHHRFRHPCRGEMAIPKVARHGLLFELQNSKFETFGGLQHWLLQ